jgi:hypothetical protein
MNERLYRRADSVRRLYYGRVLALSQAPADAFSSAGMSLGKKGPASSGQGLTLVYFPAQLEPCLTHKSTLHTLNTP